PREAELHVLPTLWFRNDWASWITRQGEKPVLKQIDAAGTRAIAATHGLLGTYHLYCEGDAPLLFTENSTNHAALHLDYPDIGPYLKDGINNYPTHGRHDAVNPQRCGSKAAAHYHLKVGAGQSATVRLRLTAQTAAASNEAATRRSTSFGTAF